MSNSPNIHPDSPDALSAVLSRLQLTADVYTNADFCGTWAVDTSGSRHIPFHLVGRGEAWLHLDDQPVRKLSSGDLVLFPRDDHHIVASSSDVPPEELINALNGQDEGPLTHLICGAFEFRNPAAWPLLDSLAAVIVLDLRDMSASPQVRTLIDLMIGELLGEAPGHCTVVNQLAYLLFIHVIRYQINNGEVNSGLLAALFDPKISKALSAIHNHADQRWTLESLAREAAMGRSAFARRFNELTGTTAMSYLTAWRMQEATTLLQDTVASVLEISERSGYESEAAFRKAYKKTTGQAPGAVRRQATA
jgi:AraC-like DNA-binding protein